MRKKLLIGAVVWAGAAVWVGLALAEAAARNGRLCNDSPTGLHCDCWYAGSECDYCQFGDGPHATW